MRRCSHFFAALIGQVLCVGKPETETVRYQVFTPWKLCFPDIAQPYGGFLSFFFFREHCLSSLAGGERGLVNQTGRSFDGVPPLSNNNCVAWHAGEFKWKL